MSGETTRLQLGDQGIKAGRVGETSRKENSCSFLHYLGSYTVREGDNSMTGKKASFQAIT